VTGGLGKEPYGLFQRIRQKRWLEMTGKQRGFEMTKRNGFGRQVSFKLYAIPKLIDRDI